TWVTGNEANVRIFHGSTNPACSSTGAGWSALTGQTVDTLNHIVCGNTTSLSPFTLAEPQPALTPTLPVPANITVEATGPAGATVTFVATATDAQDGDLVPSCTPASGATFPLGTTTVSCSATNSLGFTAQASFTVTVVDTTAPIFGGVPGTIVA